MTVDWMPAAISADLPAATALPLAAPFGALALWRSRSGLVSAFADRCPHRGMRLSHGFVRGEALSCIYHGWSYGPGGECLRIPAHPGLEPPAAIRVARYPAQEAGGLVWIAESLPEHAPPSLSGLAPLRSLTADAPPQAVEALGAGRGEGGLVAIEMAGASFAVLLAPQPEGRTLVHVLVEASADTGRRIAVSRAAETLRRAAEARGREEAA